MSEEERGPWWRDDSETGKAVSLIVAQCNSYDTNTAVRRRDVLPVLDMVLGVLNTRDEQNDDAETQKALDMLNSFSNQEDDAEPAPRCNTH